MGERRSLGPLNHAVLKGDVRGASQFLGALLIERRLRIPLVPYSDLWSGARSILAAATSSFTERDFPTARFAVLTISQYAWGDFDTSEND
jgi:hypothetical protein